MFFSRLKMEKIIFIKMNIYKFLFLSIIQWIDTKPLTTTERWIGHRALTRNLDLISDVLSSATTTMNPTTPIMSTTTTTAATTKEIYHFQCHICGIPFKMVSGLKDHMVEEHYADPTVINNAPGKFFPCFFDHVHYVKYLQKTLDLYLNIPKINY